MRLTFVILVSAVFRWLLILQLVRILLATRSVLIGRDDVVINALVELLYDVVPVVANRGLNSTFISDFRLTSSSRATPSSAHSS